MCVCVYVYVCQSHRQCVTERSVCALNIGAKSNIINRSHKQITPPPLVMALIDPSIIQKFNGQRYGHTVLGGKATSKIAAEGKILASLRERQSLTDTVMKCSKGSAKL